MDIGEIGGYILFALIGIIFPGYLIFYRALKSMFGGNTVVARIFMIFWIIIVIVFVVKHGIIGEN